MEYQILVGSCSHCQKVLNTWKHTYDLIILSTAFNGVGDLANDLIIVLTRTPKEFNKKGLNANV